MVIKGQAHWAKIVGAPGWGYKKAHKEWSMDLAIDEATETALLNAGMDPKYVKDKGDDRGKFLTFRRRELKADGTAGKPIAIEDNDGTEWNQKTLIGNGSVVLAKIALNEIEGQKGTKPGIIKVRVKELVPFEGREDGGDFDDYEDDGSEKWS